MSVTLIIVIATSIVSFVTLNNREVFGKYLFSPYQVVQRKQYYRIFSHAFLHADFMHLFVNMFVLFIFGSMSERYFAYFKGGSGAFNYSLLYAGGIMFATLPALRKHKDNFMYSSVGASGAVSAVLFSSIVFNPLEGITFIFFPFFSIPAFIFGILYLIYEAYMDKRGQDFVAHDAHYYGAIFGAVFTFLVVPESFVLFFVQLGDYFTYWFNQIAGFIFVGL